MCRDLNKAEEDPARILAVKDRFYDLLCKGSGNQTVRTLLETLHTRIALTRAASLRAPGTARRICGRDNSTAWRRRAAERGGQGASELAMLHVRRAASAALSQFSFGDSDNVSPNREITQRS